MTVNITERLFEISKLILENLTYLFVYYYYYYYYYYYCKHYYYYYKCSVNRTVFLLQGPSPK